MKTKEILPTLQLFYAGLMAESFSLFEQYGLLEKVTQQKWQEDLLSAQQRNEQFGFLTPKEIFQTHRELFGFSDWNIEQNISQIAVTNTACKLCAIAKTMGTSSPCDVCCINPLNALCGALEKPHMLHVERTLWNSDHCRFIMLPQ